MTRALCLLALVTIVAGLTGTSPRESVASSHGTPLATPLQPAGVFEIPDSVPISLTIRNDGDADDRLLGGSTPVAIQVEVYRTRLVAGQREMQPDPEGLVIPAGESLILDPGGGHLMLLGLRADLVQGENFPLTLHFDNAGDVTVTVRVRRKVDAAGITPFPPVVVSGLTISLASTPPAPAGAATS